MNYQHLIEAERYQIQTFLEEGVLPGGIARRLHRAASTIGREIERNAGAHGYQAKAAEGQAQQRRQVAASQPRIDAERTPCGRPGPRHAGALGGRHDGRGGPEWLVTLVERHSRFVVVVPVKDGCAETVLAAILHGLYPWQSAVRGCVTSIAWDNGSEFARHAVLDLALGCTSYFARPYASWERGSNENANGLIRQYAPKKTDLGLLTDVQVQRIADRLNDRPREVLAFRTPREVFEASLIAMQRQQKNRYLRKARALAQVQRE